MAAGDVKEAFDRDGVFIARKAIPVLDLIDWQRAWDVFSREGRTAGWNPVQVQGPFPSPLADLYKHPAILDLVEAVFGPDIGLYNFRFVVKDAQARGSVFLHQDTGYHVGHMTKLSAFVALSECNILNGGMQFALGTHRYGYLGDAGEINRTGLRDDWAVDFEMDCPELQPGDVVLMDSRLWHGSVKHTGGPDRVLADVIYQPANDPSGLELVRGHWRCEPQPWLRAANIFTRSRTSRLKEMQEKLKKAGVE